mmetsp:Transcript_23234/g.37414  ORF Transcript_23234/g.37414 Transcript_23234/m.37414 type:complete len:129 (-) Transcript_23234:861-1247(-)
MLRLALADFRRVSPRGPLPSSSFGLHRRLLSDAAKRQEAGSSQASVSSASAQNYSPPRPAPVPTETLLFRITNPELLADPNKWSSWFLVIAVWVGFGGYFIYLRRDEIKEDEEMDTAMIGPRKRNGNY